ncbi:hypothetical protein AD998_09375 [bacterium 336/3]|nr:hypothetical protein AD998_09375 [bacterium 336/3]
MLFIYILYIFTFILAPVISNLIIENVIFQSYKKYLIGFSIFFFIHNLFWSFGYSIQGNFPDYIIFSLEYFSVCLWLLLGFRVKKSYIKVLSILGFIPVGLTLILASFFLIWFPPITQDYIPYQNYSFGYQDNHYQTRVFVYGFVTFVDTKYTFQTYQVFENVPIEYHLDTTLLSSIKNSFVYALKDFNVRITEYQGQKQLIFSSGKSFYTKNIIL